ncbi:hypothetical protein HXX76_011820 [Chlamydomonas incerta]|uniref:Uncharacterized protein n=1 Tax=Chlamydomonas incerta TaxID=51695 RepID=A0A835VUB4_CHLIN|nr:hypothetical protein HXX76_011820 [Chlamydomonas incerta]|eukprot:KAG2428140.1 hypothetical protein HXX76_011820 [Chlamydomonas incerta]
MGGLRPRKAGRRVRATDVVWGVVLSLVALVLLGYGWHLRSKLSSLGTLKSKSGPKAGEYGGYGLPPYASAPVLVSYAFYEKDLIQRGNMDFFLTQGWVAPPGGQKHILWVFVVAGEQCSPCSGAFPISTPLPADPDIGISRATQVDLAGDDPEPELEGGGLLGVKPRLKGPGPGKTLVLRRSENVGMDIASHNASLEYVARHMPGGLRPYRYFILLNSSTKGPFYPAYMPPWWHWTHAFLERFQPLPQDDSRRKHSSTLRVLAPGIEYGNSGSRPEVPAVVRAVGSSLVCLPDVDAGGPGPRLESWAMALDDVALQVMIDKGVLKVRMCKTCTDEENGIVVGGEYGITWALFEAGYNVATLMSKYARDVDWRDRRHWGCNDQVHPSRHGTYDGIAFHPYETIFVKSSWHVADPYTRRYSTWVTQHREGDAGTDGEWNEKLYKYAISAEAQLPNLLEAAYNVTRVRQLLAKQRDAEAAEIEAEQRAAGERAMSHDM